MQIHEIRAPRGARKRKKIVGRGPGSGHGKTSCRGENGQKAHSTARAVVIASEGGQMPLIRRLPKVGFRSKRPVLYQIVNLESLNKFKDGAVVSLENLKAKGLVKTLNKPFKILGDGELKKSLTIQTANISHKAKEKVIKAGGKIELVSEEKNNQKDSKKN